MCPRNSFPQRTSLNRRESFPFPRLRRSNSVRIEFNETPVIFATPAVEPPSVDVPRKKMEKREEESWRSSSCRAIEQHLPGSHDCLAIAVPTCFEHATQFVCVSLFYLAAGNRQGGSCHGLLWPFNDRVFPHAVPFLNLQISFISGDRFNYFTFVLFF